MIVLALQSCYSDKCLISLDNYEFLSVKCFNDVQFDIGAYDMMKYIRSSKIIKGPVIGYMPKEVKIFNSEKGDTISIIVYGNDHKYFKIKKCYFKSEVPILPMQIMPCK